jgi:hypothetical protein
MSRILFLFTTFFFTAKALWAEEVIAVAPSAPYERFIIFQTLAIFWAGIIGLVVIIRMKLREIERTQRMGSDKEEKNIPLLD